MSSPLEKFVGKDSISSKLKGVSFNTPDSGGITFSTPDYGDVTFETPELNAAQQILHHKITPKTAAPKVKRVQRAREEAANALKSSRELKSIGSRGSRADTTMGDNTLENIILNLGGNVEDMKSSEIRKNSKGLLIKPTENDDIFAGPPARGTNLDWMKRYSRDETPPRTRRGQKSSDSSPGSSPFPAFETATPSRDPKNKKVPKKELGIPFPNFGRFWGAKYSLGELQCASLIKMFAQCDPDDIDRVNELYDLAWLIKVSTAMLQCDTEDRARVQELVRWAQNLRNESDWQSSIPLGWNLKQQQYVGPRPSDEERQRFVDYAWYMNHNQPRTKWDPEKEKRYNDAAVVVFAFKEKYPNFPHDYPPGYPGEHSSWRNGTSGPVSKSTGHQRKLSGKKVEECKVDLIKRPGEKKRKAGVMKEEVISEPKKKKVSAKKAVSKTKTETNSTDGGSLRRSYRNQRKDTIAKDSNKQFS